MSFTLVVTSHGRWEYLARAIKSTRGLPIDRAIISFDGVDCDQMASAFPAMEILSTGIQRQGLTANLTQAWGALTPDDEWVFHVEEDFLVNDAPLQEMADTLDAYRNVANMVLVRNPANVPHEQRTQSMLRAQTYDLTDRGGWLEHRGGFWLNPFVAHASLLRSLTPGTEDKLTTQCLARGLSFGFWGAMDDPPRCEHVGVLGGMGSPGWKP